jgi:GNAT superfamily N-acetyltransferase
MAYTICPIPKPISEEHLTQYTHIRLAALKANPEAFGSTFARESAFPHLQWRARVNNPARITFFATTAPSTIPVASLGDTGSYHDEDDQESKWVGTLSLLGPDMLRGVAFPPKIAEAMDRDAEIYMLTGMWVDPEFRKKGVGRQLVEHALRAARDFSVIDNDQQNREGNDRRGRILALEVHNANVEAQRLYQRQGFVVQPGDNKEDKKWMALNIR